MVLADENFLVDDDALMVVVAVGVHVELESYKHEY
jgi:hypothetical protein